MFAFLKSPRTIFIGDVHGCPDELKEMIEKLRTRSRDRVIMLGDLINRGPAPAEVVRFVYNEGLECIKGNHEDNYLKNFKTNSAYKKLKSEISPGMHTWIENLPLYREGKNFLAVHAGLQPGKHPAETDPEILTTIRTWDGKGKDLKNPANTPWYELYSGNKPVFYGHWARMGLNIRDKTIGLDSGLVYGRGLTGYILEQEKLIQVRAKRFYYTPPSLRDY